MITKREIKLITIPDFLLRNCPKDYKIGEDAIIKDLLVQSVERRDRLKKCREQLKAVKDFYKAAEIVYGEERLFNPGNFGSDLDFDEQPSETNESGKGSDNG